MGSEVELAFDEKRNLNLDYVIDKCNLNNEGRHDAIANPTEMSLEESSQKGQSPQRVQGADISVNLENYEKKLKRIGEMRKVLEILHKHYKKNSRMRIVSAETKTSPPRKKKQHPPVIMQDSTEDFKPTETRPENKSSSFDSFMTDSMKAELEQKIQVYLQNQSNLEQRCSQQEVNSLKVPSLDAQLLEFQGHHRSN